MRLPLALAFILAASAAQADDAPVSTAASTPAPSVAQQIDDYLKTSPALETDHLDAVDGIVPRRDRKIHGEVSVGVGTGGYRSIYGRADMPVGESGNVSIAVQQSRGRFGHAWAGGFHGQRCDDGPLGMGSPMDVRGGPYGRCAGPFPFR
ncbi:MAG: hypothetical protein U1C74_23365 [Phenylobacterium sp.]|nr:hypothetical protein [Phenylobacterium sp.]